MIGNQFLSSFKSPEGLLKTSFRGYIMKSIFYASFPPILYILISAMIIIIKIILLIAFPLARNLKYFFDLK